MQPSLPVPCFAVIFVSKLRAADEAYAETLVRMKELGTRQPGFLGIESARAADGKGVTVVFYDSAESAQAWARNPSHREAQHTGRKEWYEYYEMYYANVVSGRAWSAADAGIPEIPAAREGA